MIAFAVAFAVALAFAFVIAIVGLFFKNNRLFSGVDSAVLEVVLPVVSSASDAPLASYRPTAAPKLRSD